MTLRDHSEFVADKLVVLWDKTKTEEEFISLLACDMLYWTFKTLQKKCSHITNLLSSSLKNKKVMNEKVWPYSERLFSLLGGRKDENFLILTGSLTNMEDPTQAILWFCDLIESNQEDKEKSMWKLRKIGKTEKNYFAINTGVYVLCNICVALK